METLRKAPSESDFVALHDHQSQTPASFHDGPAILYHQSSSCTLKISKHDLDTTTAFASLAPGATSSGHVQVNGHSDDRILPNGDSHASDEDLDKRNTEAEIEIPKVDVWVTSGRLIFFSPAQTAGVSFPYPSISLHAIQRPSTSTSSTTPEPPGAVPTAAAAAASLFLQILPEASATFDDHDPDETISLNIIPNTSSTSSTATTSLDPAVTASSATSDAAMEESSGDSSFAAAGGGNDEVSAIYAALSACANLHPDLPMLGDEDDDDDENGDGDGLNDGGGGMQPAYISANDGGLPPPMPGSGGWITAENVGEYFDEEGNWRGGLSAEGGGGGGGGAGGDQRLGEGAGRVRGRDEDEGAEGDGDGEETKWNRTG